MNMVVMPKSEHLKKQKEFVDNLIKNNTKESAMQRLIEAGILDKDGKMRKPYS
jgi:hypothetical protein